MDKRKRSSRVPEGPTGCADSSTEWKANNVGSSWTMPEIHEFEASLHRFSHAQYGQWRTVDLHNHSPASHDFSGNRDTALDDAVAHLIAKPMDVVMFTDHNALPEATFVEQLSRRSGRTVLRGMELNVFVDAWSKPESKIQKQAFFHLLVGFAPDENADYWLTDLHKRCRHEIRDVSGTEISGLTAPIPEICNTLQQANALIIPAHLHKRSDAFKSRSVDDIYMDAEFLKLAREHFTALEVTDLKTAEFFDGKHAETGSLRKTCIRSSDAHEVTSIGERVTWVQMEEPTFRELKAGLEIPARVSLVEPDAPASYVIGINVRGQFFTDLWLSLSPHCNAFIGVKGSGKTSVLECLRFALGSLVPESRREEVKSHLSHILGQGGTVRVLVKREDGAKVLVERSVSAPDVFRLMFEDDRCEEVRNPDALMFPSFILGWHEIEQAATDPDVRQAYLDTIADREKIRQLQETADDAMGKIRSLHEQVVNRYAGYRSLRSRVGRLKDLRSGLRELTDANLFELKNTYETANRQRDLIERLASWLEEHSDLEPNWETAGLVPDIPSMAGNSPIERFAGFASEIVTSLRSHAGSFADEHKARISGYAGELAEKDREMAAAFSQFAAEYDVAVAKLSDEQRRLLETHRQVLDQTRELPTLEQRMEEERGRLEGLLGTLAKLCRVIASALDSQTALRRARVDELAAQLEDYGVRLQVAPRTRLGVFEQIASGNPDGANVFGELNQRFGEAERHHARLAKAYESTRRDLVEGFPLLLSSVAFGDYLAAFEGDDLSIFFNVGQGDEDYRAIDQLSAGQRCTAVFPLLLKLQEGPLIVDQPEDNLDNRHIADTIAPALLEDKRARQIAFTSHNANLVVLTDAEQIALFDSDGSTGEVSARGFLCTSVSSITKHVIATLDGGRSALRLRYQKYGVESLEEMAS